MKKIIIISFFLLITTSLFGQQYLWSTEQDTSSIRERYVPLSRVTNEVLEFYDLYDYYLDLTGFNKDGFYELFKEAIDNSEEWEEIKENMEEIKDLTVYALKTNTGQGSMIAVMSISEINVDIIIFSNIPEPGSIVTYDSDRDKFEKWYKSLLK